MILYIHLANEVCTPKTKGVLNKLLSKMGYLIKYTGSGLAVPYVENIDQVNEINEALQPYKDKYGNDFSIVY